MTRRVIAVVLIAVVCAIVAIAYAVRASRTVVTSPAGLTTAATAAETSASLGRPPYALLRSTAREHYGDIVAIFEPPEDATTRFPTGLNCDRVAMGPSGGVCLTVGESVVMLYQAVVFDARFQATHRIALGGVPSRVRLSPDGRLAGITVFVAGHGYTDTTLSTQTTLVDTQTGTTIADLENFTVLRNGRPFKRVDFNFWGVTFAGDSRIFYVTLGTGRELLLLRGDVTARTATVIAEGVECPSISPDNTRVAFKKRTTVDDAMVWRLATLELASGAVRLIDGETRSVDDQVEWLDNRRITYVPQDGKQAGRADVWVVDTSGGAASLWATGADSPSILGDR